MPRVVSFIVLVAIVLLVASLFFQVMAQFILPLFLAGILVVVFRPLHDWIRLKCGDRPRTAAGLTTLAICLIVLVPLCAMLWNGYREGIVAVGDFQSDTKGEVWTEIEEKAKGLIRFFERLGVGEDQQESILKAGIDKLRELAVPLALGGMRLVFSILVGIAIMMLSVYYFFADGPAMVATIMRLSPLDDKYELQLLEQFGRISRAVVVATLLSAVVQGLLAGIGYYFAGVGPVFFLTGLTMLMAMVPFVGAASVWAPTCAWIYLFGGESAAAGTAVGAPTSAVLLAVYCATLVSASDNIIKPLVLHGQSNLHPLLALLSVLGGAQTLGPIGILVGPMVVAFLQALLNMLHSELESFGLEKHEANRPPGGDNEPAKNSDECGAGAAPTLADDAGDDPAPPDKRAGSPAKGNRRRRRRKKDR